MYVNDQARRERARAADATLALPAGPDAFPALLQAYRERAGRSRNALARQAGIDPGYVTHIEKGDCPPPRQPIIEALSRVLHLTVPEHSRLLLAAGYAPLAVLQLGSWDDALQAVADVLTDWQVTPRERDQFREVVQQTAARVRRRAQLRGAS